MIIRTKKWIWGEKGPSFWEISSRRALTVLACKCICQPGWQPLCCDQSPLPPGTENPGWALAAPMWSRRHPAEPVGSCHLWCLRVLAHPLFIVGHSFIIVSLLNVLKIVKLKEMLNTVINKTMMKETSFLDFFMVRKWSTMLFHKHGEKNFFF